MPDVSDLGVPPTDIPDLSDRTIDHILSARSSVRLNGHRSESAAALDAWYGLTDEERLEETKFLLGIAKSMGTIGP